MLAKQMSDMKQQMKTQWSNGSSSSASAEQHPSSSSPSTSAAPTSDHAPKLDMYAVFISNPVERVALWKQKSEFAGTEGGVVWDYHVILIVMPHGERSKMTCTCGQSEGQSTGVSSTSSAPGTSLSSHSAKPCPLAAWVYDQDSSLPFPCPLSTYARDAFHAHELESLKVSGRMEEYHERLYRVVAVTDLFEHFASDRSHMLYDESKDLPVDQLTSEDYFEPPPSYPPIGGGLKHNLDEYRKFQEHDVEKIKTSVRHVQGCDEGLVSNGSHSRSQRGMVMNEGHLLKFFHTPLHMLQG